MKTAQNFRDVIAWQKAHEFVTKAYQFSSSFPKEEMYGLTSQFRRAAVSIPSNIAEGFVKKGNADKKRFFNIAQGSIEECKYYLILARDLKFNESSELDSLIEEVSKILYAYSTAIPLK